MTFVERLGGVNEQELLIWGGSGLSIKLGEIRSAGVGHRVEEHNGCIRAEGCSNVC